MQVRMQSEGKLPEGTPKKYPNAFRAYGIIARYIVRGFKSFSGNNWSIAWSCTYRERLKLMQQKIKSL